MGTFTIKSTGQKFGTERPASSGTFRLKNTGQEIQYNPNPTPTRPNVEAITQTPSFLERQQEKPNWGRVALGTVLEGADQAATGISSTASWLESALLKPVGAVLGDNELYTRGPLYQLNQKLQEDAQINREVFAEEFDRAGTAGDLLEKYGTATVAAIPQAAMALMTAGASLGAQGTTAGVQAASTAAQSGLARSVGTAVQNMAKNPQYWLSFLQGAGNDYEAAKADGANELQATSYALLTNLVNSAVEIGGGIDTLPQNLQQAARGGKSALREWVRSMIDEGREEVVQGAVSQLAQTVYGKNNPLFSTTDENAVVSPQRAAEEFAGGAIVGGILGGGQIAAGRAIDAISRRRGAGTTKGAAQTQEQGNTIPQQQEAVQGATEPQTDVLTQNVQQAFAQQNTASVQAETDNFLPVDGSRVNVSSLTDEQMNRLGELWEQGAAGMDATGNAFQANPQQHIDQRTSDSVAARSVNAFQFDWPQLHQYMKQAAESLIADADLSLQMPMTRRRERGMQGRRYIQSITESPSLRSAMNEGLTRNDIITAAQALINDMGQENYAAAKRLELVLDEMLTYGYTTVTGESVPPNQAYIEQKNRIAGAQPEEVFVDSEELPLWDLEEGARSPYNATPARASQSASMQENGTQSVGAAAAGFDPYTNQLRQFGAIPEGENPARPIDVPQRTSPENRVSRTARTILEAAATPDSAVGDIGQAVVDGQFSYMPVTNQQATAAAEQAIRDKGWEQALADWRADVRSGQTSERTTAMGATLYNNAVNAGDTQAALDIAYDMSVAIRNGARATQAARILKTLTPSGKLYMLQKEVSRLNGDLTEQLTGQRDIQIDEGLADAYLNAETDAARNAALQAIYQNIADQMPSNFREKWNAWRYMAMLANPRTHVRNVVGNVGFQPLRMTKNLVATAIESGLNAAGLNVERTHSFTASPDLYRAAWQDYDNVADTLSGNKYSDAQSEIADRRRIFRNSALETVRRRNSRALELEDVLFKRITYADTLANYLRANNVTAEQLQRGEVDANLLARARDFAAQEALKATYQDRNAFSNRVNRIVKDAGVVGQAILPFSRTPANILARGVEYSPAGLAKALTYDLYQVQRGNKTAAQSIDSIAAGLTGSALLALGAYLFSEGLVTTGGGDSEDDEWNELMGHQNYALELPNGTSVTLDWLAPESLPFFMGVELASSMGEGGMDAESIYDALRSVANPMLELSMLQSVNDLIDSVQYAEEAPLAAMIPSAIISYFSQAIPTIGGQIERTGEESRMSTYTDRNSTIPTDVQYALGRASSRIPGWDYQQTPYIDAWGREEGSGDELTRFVSNFLNPAYISQVDVDNVERELQRVRDATGDTSVFPDRAARYITVNGERKDLTSEEYDTYARTLGQTRYSLVSQAMQMPEYRRMSDTEKADYIGDLYEYANAVAKSEVSGYALDGWIANARTAPQDIGVSPAEYIALYERYGSGTMSGQGYEKVKDAVENGLTIEEYIDYRDATKDLTSDKDADGKTISGSKKEKVLNAINDMDLSSTEKDWLYYLNGYSESTIDEAPWR